ncbi:fluoride efflux transporter FluC [Desertibacillus haloalkaliphilus]|uniref:fluoride efflux transporter FluC n=1 Tax=Desertibacillus haloalkaliphilus TaxID=1328930 RepID=UPI001C25E1AF|nr:CrcB family protein [Desertibacillus haloalkaliphilus]MBU8906666.1 CrcB family protein [Desertibacillus haloalkaliphilus]
MEIKTIIAIAIGAAVGTIARYSLNIYTLAAGYPIGTVIENLVGSLLLGFLTGFFIHHIPKDWLKAGLGVGLCGGFTTMSTLAADTLLIYNQMNVFQSLLYVLVSFGGGVAFAILGYLIGDKAGARNNERKVARS